MPHEPTNPDSLVTALTGARCRRMPSEFNLAKTHLAPGGPEGTSPAGARATPLVCSVRDDESSRKPRTPDRLESDGRDVDGVRIEIRRGVIDDSA